MGVMIRLKLGDRDLICPPPSTDEASELLAAGGNGLASPKVPACASQLYVEGVSGGGGGEERGRGGGSGTPCWVGRRFGERSGEVCNRIPKVLEACCFVL